MLPPINANDNCLVEKLAATPLLFRQHKYIAIAGKVADALAFVPTDAPFLYTCTALLADLLATNNPCDGLVEVALFAVVLFIATSVLFAPVRVRM